MPTYSRTLRLSDNILSVKALPPNLFSKVNAYEYVSKGVAPNKINEVDRLQTPSGQLLVEDAIFFEAEVDNSTNPPTFRQQVINGVLANDSLKIHQYQTFVPFTYPGTIDSELISYSRSGHVEKSIGLLMEAPVQTEVVSTVHEFIQTSKDISSDDYGEDGASGLWRPNQWASIKAFGAAVGSVNTTRSSTFITSQDFRGFRVKDPSTFDKETGAVDIARFNGSTIMRQYNERARLEVDAVDVGPPNPIGSKWVLDIDLQPAFIGVNGTTYYKKSIVVSSAIPAKQNASVPYTTATP